MSVCATTAALLTVGLGLLQGQTKPPARDKGPRAIGLLELPANGKGHLIPIAIMVNGEFYDAGAYKAAPVPMALEPGTVYEIERTGLSLGLFTITAPLENNDKDWIAEGTWQTAEMLAAKAAKSKKASSSKPRGLDEDEGPPKLRRAQSAGNSSAAPQSPSTATAKSAPPQSGSSPQSSSTTASTAQASSPSPAASTSPGQSEPQQQPRDQDQDRPVLHRGKPAPAELKAEAANTGNSSPPTASTKPSSKTAPQPTALSSSVKILTAISDAAGPEPHSYEYHLAGDDEQSFRKQILAIAADEIRARVAQEQPAKASTKRTAHSRSTTKSTAKKLEPEFEDVQMRVFDLSSSNEPEVVLMARARLPQPTNGNGVDREYRVTAVARDDIYGQLHKALANVTDASHLDVIPQLQLVDALDADGDGRGELLFRRVSDTGSDYVIYRAIGDQLWPLFKGQTAQ